jgi:hypothetical protein
VRFWCVNTDSCEWELLQFSNADFGIQARPLDFQKGSSRTGPIRCVGAVQTTNHNDITKPNGAAYSFSLS